MTPRKDIPRMSRESARHITAEQAKYGITHDGIQALCLNRAYDALGYRNWADYVHAELRDSVDKLGENEKAELAKSLRYGGCSLRAISAVVGWSHTSVKNRTEVVAATSIGADGLKYRQPRSRKNYASSVLNAAWDFRNAAEKLDDLIYDERFENTRDDVADQLRSHLLVAQKTADTQLDNIGKASHS